MNKRLLLLLLSVLSLAACREKTSARQQLDIPLNRKITELLKAAQAETDDNKKASLYGEASELLISKGDVRQAMVAARQGERANPTQRQCLVSIAEVFIMEGKLAEATITMSDALQRHPKYGRAHFVMGNLQASKQDYAAALKSYALAEKNGFNEARLLLNMAAINAKLKKYPVAAGIYANLLRANPDLAEANLGAGITAMQQNKKTDARKFFEKYLALSPNSSEAGRVRSWLGKL